MKTRTHEGELNLEKLYNTILNYKWLIISFILISTILMAINLYFKPSIYNSSSILEVKSQNKGSMPSDFISSALSFGSSNKVEKEVAILKTFALNDKALEEVNFQTKIFVKESYRDIEVYQNPPVAFNHIKIFDHRLIGKKIVLTPHKDFFTLEIEHSIFSSFIHFISNFNNKEAEKKYQFEQKIKRSDFELSVKKLKPFNKPIKFILCGENQKVFYNIISESLSVQQLGQNVPLIKISFEDTIPQRAEDYINALTKSFIDESVKNKNEQNNKILTFLNEQLNDIRNTLKVSEENLETYKTNNQVIEPSIQAKNYINKLSNLEISISDNLLKQKLVNNIFIFAKNNNNLDAIAPSLMELKDKPTLQLITTLQNLQIKENNLKIEFTEQHPKVITIKKQIYNLKRKILYNIKNLKNIIKQKNLSLKKEKERYEAKISTLPNKEKNLVNIKRDYQVSSTMYNYLLKKKTESELLIVSTLADFRTLDEAHTLALPSKPKRGLLLILGPIIGLILGLLLAIILEALNKKIKTKEILETLTDLPLLGIIPELKNKNIKLEVFNAPNSVFTESYRSLRSNLPKKKKNKASLIAITSTVGNEGKTTLTANLASVFQMADYKCIILNLDLRKPTLHTYFNLENKKGMSSYLSGKDDIQNIIFATKHTNLHVITSGPIPPNPSELILSNKLSELLEVLKPRYDYIFLDTAPIGLVSDSVELMKLADQNLIVLRENYAEKSFLESLDRIIEKNHLNNIGLVLNRSKSKRKSYGYGYGY